MSGYYGFRTGDRVRLGDTGLIVQVESSSAEPGSEISIGMGNTGRDGIAMRAVRTTESCDLVLLDVLIIDPLLGVRTASIGIRDGRIAAIGRAGNPDTGDDIDIVIGTGTSVVPAAGLIATAGAVDTHVHLLTPRIMEAMLASGVTTALSQEAGPFWGVGVNSRAMLRAAYASFDAWPVNIGMLGRGSSSRSGPMVEALESGVCAFKVHEDTGAWLRSLDSCLSVAEEHDVQVAIHTDGLNEGLSVLDTLSVLDRRVAHAYHVEGCGGGHAPDVLRLAGHDEVLASSTNPTLPFGRDAVAEHYAMIADVHGLHLHENSDRAMVESRVRAGTMAGENILHDLGVIAVTSSDAQGMGRAGETIKRTFAMASVVKASRNGDPLLDEAAARDGHDNERVLRYLAKLTTNPSLVHGLSHEVGSLQPGRLADIVLWAPATFGAKPEMVFKSGFPAWGATGDPNASIMGAEPRVLGPLFGGMGATPADVAVIFTNQAAADAGNDVFPTRRRRVAVRGTRSVRSSQLVRHGVLGQVDVDPHTARVSLDDRELRLDPVDRTPLTRLYFL